MQDQRVQRPWLVVALGTVFVLLGAFILFFERPLTAAPMGAPYWLLGIGLVGAGLVVIALVARQLLSQRS